MFGHYKKRREKRRKKERKEFDVAKKQYEDEEKKFSESKNDTLNQKVLQAKEDRAKARQEGKAYAEDILGRDVQGLNPEKRKAMQYEANKGIQRSMQSAQRKLLGEQGLHGISGKSGIAYAQNRDLQRMAMEARGGVQRDIDKLNADMEQKNRAAMLGIEQGEASQAQLDKQIALDELELMEEKKRQRFFEDQMYRQFNRI